MARSDTKEKSMNIRQIAPLSLLLTIALCLPLSAQQVDIPDPNLRQIVAETLKLESKPITQVDMLRLDRLDAPDRGITDITGLQYAHNLEYLELRGNPISDLSPLAGLVKLRRLFVWRCEVSDISPLVNLIELKYLDISENQISDIQPLANLTNLLGLGLHFNNITDVSPLKHLVNLEWLNIRYNPVINLTPLDDLTLSDFFYDETCDMPPLPLQPRLDNRTYPSIFAAWGGPGWIRTLNRPDLSDIENLASHDLWFSVPHFGLDFSTTPHGFKVRGNIEEAIHRRDEFHSINPNMVFIVDIKMRYETIAAYSEDWPYWIKNSDGSILGSSEGAYGVMDFTHPYIQDRIVEQALAVAQCGLYDGIFFDYWKDTTPVLGPSIPLDEELRARDIILKRIRSQVRSNFLIMGNTNVRTLPKFGYQINGSFMETPVPGHFNQDEVEYWLGRAQESLNWLAHNIREPRINALEGQSLHGQPPDSPANLRWMRAITTLSLTHSNGYVLFSKFGGHHHYWYDFWDADLGKPVGEKSQLYDENTPGLYIREFTNGWAVYNHSGEAQVITLPEEAQGVASELVNTEHTLPNLDGEMYLKAVVSDQSPVTSKNPADVNDDGVVNILDLVVVAQGFGKDGWEGDVNGDGVVNVFDLVFVANEF